MKTKRLFIGTFIEPKPLKSKYSKIKKELGGILPGRWIKPENFHITFKFLGNVPEEEIPEIQTSLKEYLDKLQNAQFELKGLGVFPNMENPKVLYIKVIDTDGILEKMQKFTEQKMEQLGFQKENRPFIPHITLKRIKYADVDKLKQKLEKYKETNFGKQDTVELNLIESITNPKGAVYKKLKDRGEKC